MTLTLPLPWWLAPRLTAQRWRAMELMRRVEKIDMSLFSVRVIVIFGFGGILVLKENMFGVL